MLLDEPLTASRIVPLLVFISVASGLSEVLSSGLARRLSGWHVLHHLAKEFSSVFLTQLAGKLVRPVLATCNKLDVQSVPRESPSELDSQARGSSRNQSPWPVPFCRCSPQFSGDLIYMYIQLLSQIKITWCSCHALAGRRLQSCQRRLPPAVA